MQYFNRQRFRYVCYRIRAVIARYFFAVDKYDEVVQAAYLFRYLEGIIRAFGRNSVTSEGVVRVVRRRGYRKCFLEEYEIRNRYIAALIFDCIPRTAGL